MCIFLSLPSQAIIKHLAESHRSCVFFLQSGGWSLKSRCHSVGFSRRLRRRVCPAFLLAPGRASPALIPCVDLSSSGLHLHLHALSSLCVLVKDTIHGFRGHPSVAWPRLHMANFIILRFQVGGNFRGTLFRVVKCIDPSRPYSRHWHAYSQIWIIFTSLILLETLFCSLFFLIIVS